MASPRYSLARYGLQASNDNVIDLRMSADVKFNAVVGFATNADLSFIAGVNVNGNVTLSIGHYEGLLGNEQLTGVANAHVGISIDGRMNSVVNCSADWRKVLINGVTVDKNDVYVNLYEARLDSALNGILKASADYSIVEEYSEILGGHVSTVNLSQDTFIANVTIPPGGKLIIDSNVFNMLLNGQNAIHLQKGDWIDLDRNVIYLDITAGTGGTLNGSIIYQARYL